MTNLEKLGEGREAEIFAWDRDNVVRVLRDPANRPRLDAEAAALSAARAAGCPVPAPGDIVEIDGRPGLIMERGGGGDLLTTLGAKPWMVVSFGQLTARVHQTLLKVQAPGHVPKTKEYLAEKIQRSGWAPSRIGAVLDVLGSLPDGDRICHGDFHPGNILFDREHPMVIDWTNVTAGDPVNDIARTMMTLKMGSPPPGTPALVLRLLKIGRALYLWSYRSSIRKLTSLDEGTIDKWTTVHLAARKAEGIEEETEEIDRHLRRRLGS